MPGHTAELHTSILLKVRRASAPNARAAASATATSSTIGKWWGPMQSPRTASTTYDIGFISTTARSATWQAVDRVERARQEEDRLDDEVDDAPEAFKRFHARRHHDSERVHRHPEDRQQRQRHSAPTTLKRAPMSGASASIRPASTVAVALPAASLAATMAPRGIGATSNSLRKPNSRSQTIEIAANMLANSTVIAAIPGTRNETKSSPAARRLHEGEADPNATSQRNGRTMLVIRLRAVAQELHHVSKTNRTKYAT